MYCINNIFLYFYRKFLQWLLSLNSDKIYNNNVFSFFNYQKSTLNLPKISRDNIRLRKKEHRYPIPVLFPHILSIIFDFISRESIIGKSNCDDCFALIENIGLGRDSGSLL
jgi:hypothetical protein